MRTKIIAVMLAILMALGGLNLFQSIRDRLFPRAAGQTSEVVNDSGGRAKVKIKNKGDIVIDQWFDVREGQTLVIDVTHSDVTIETETVDEAHVVISVSGRNMSRALEVFETMNFQVEMVGDEIRIASEAPRRSVWSGNYSMDIDINVTIPRRFNARMKTTHGDVELDDLEGRVELRTTHGDVSVKNISGPEVALVSTHGSIEAKMLSSDVVVLRTSHADIRVDEVNSRHFTATTTHSDVEIRDVRGNAKITTSHGDIVIALAESVSASLQTSHGDVTIYAPLNFAMDLDLKGARVKVASSFKFVGKVDKDEVLGGVNGGGAKIRARTTHGTVSVQNI